MCQNCWGKIQSRVPLGYWQNSSLQAISQHSSKPIKGVPFQFAEMGPNQGVASHPLC